MLLTLSYFIYVGEKPSFSWANELGARCIFNDHDNKYASRREAIMYLKRKYKVRKNPNPYRISYIIMQK